jgi:hypothetical protein
MTLAMNDNHISHDLALQDQLHWGTNLPQRPRSRMRGPLRLRRGQKASFAVGSFGTMFCFFLHRPSRSSIQGFSWFWTTNATLRRPRPCYRPA